MFKMRDIFKSRRPGEFFNNIPGVGPEMNPNPPMMPGMMGNEESNPAEPEPDADADDSFADWMGREGEMNGRPPRPRKIF